LPQCAMGLTGRDDGNDISACFASFGRPGAHPPLHKNAGLQPNADLRTIMGMLTPSAARSIGPVDTVAIAFNPKVL